MLSALGRLSPMRHSFSAARETGALASAWSRRAYHRQRQSQIARFGTLAEEEFSHDESSDISATVQGDSVEITWPDGCSHNFLNCWLKDHCRCPRCYNRETEQRMADLFHAVRPSKIMQLSLSDEVLKLIWTDGHVSEHSLNILRAAVKRSPVGTSRRRLWDSSLLSRMPVVKHERLMTEQSDGVRDCLSYLKTYGLVLVEDVPSSLEAIEAAVTRLAPPVETWFGKMWSFNNQSLDHADTAYTGYSLASHTDGCYLHDQPGLQVFQCLELVGENTGGLSTLVDGFAVAERLRLHEPEAYRLLCSVPIPYQYIDRERRLHFTAQGPVFAENPYTTEVHRVRYNAADRSPLNADSMDMSQMRRVYEALFTLERYLRDPRQVLQMQLMPGTLLIVDNWRVLHGRTEVNPQAKRTIGGCYVKRDDFINSLRQYRLL